MTKPTIFVIGPTGYVGFAVVRRLSEKHSADFDLQVGVRDVGNAKHLKDLPGVTLVQAEVGGDGLTEKFCGVDALFIIPPPAFRCVRVEKTASDAKVAGVNFVLVLGDAIAEMRWTMFGSESAKMEEAVKAVGINLCILRVHYVYENIFSFAETVRSSSFLACLCGGERRFAQVSVTDIAKVASSVLTSWRRHTNKTYVLVGQLIGFNDVANALTSSLKKDVRYYRLPYHDIRGRWLRQGLSWYVCDYWFEFFMMVEAGSPTLTTADLSVVESITGEPPLAFQKFVDSASARFRKPR